MKIEQIDVDQIWRDLGTWGKYTWKQLASYLFICVSWVIHQLTIVFIGYRPDYKCRPDPNRNISTYTNVSRVEYNECKIKTFYNTSGVTDVEETSCTNGWEYDIPIEQSFVTEWDFVCENAELAELTQSLLIFGMMVGTFLCPMLSDKYGRKPVMVFSHVLQFVIVMGTAFSPNYYVFLLLRILTGCVSQGALSGTTLSLEALPTEVRSIEECLALGMWTTAICIMAPIAYLLRDVSWRYLQVTFALMSVWSIFQWWMLDESLRWVLANGHIDWAKQIIKNACKWNNKDYDEIIKKSGLEDLDVPESKVAGQIEDKKDKTNGEAVEMVNLVDEEAVTPTHDYSCFQIIKNTTILKVSLIIWFMWITDSLVYYGLFLISSDLYGDRYINFFLSGLIEYPAAVFLFWGLNSLGRKMTSMLCHLFGALGLIVATALRYSAGEDNTTMLAASTAFTLLGKMAVTGAFTSSYVVTPELYPTNMRNTGLGIAAFMGKVGGMISPYFRNVSAVIPWLPGAVFSIMNIITVILLAYIPETNGIDLPQSMDELTEWYRVNKFSFKIGRNEAADVSKKKKAKPNGAVETC